MDREISPFPENLGKHIERAAKHAVKIYLCLNKSRSTPTESLSIVRKSEGLTIPATPAFVPCVQARQRCANG